MKKKSLGINAALNMTKTAFGVIFPLITFPYVSRILGVDNIGKYNFSYSVVNYASLFAALGVFTYAVRECSRVREDRARMEEKASEIFSINLISTIISYLVLFALLAVVPKFGPYKPLIYVLSLEIIFTTFGCEWVYTIYEDYLYITLRVLAVYILSLILLFGFVHTEQDLMRYTIVSTISVCGASLANLIGRRRYCSIRFTTHLNLKQHLGPIMAIFANSITTSIYVNSDMVILGILSTDTHTGLYAVAVRIYTIIKRLLAAIIHVSIPRLSHYWGIGDKKAIEETSYQVFNTLLILVAPAMIGLFSLSKAVVLLISGPAFAEAEIPLALLSIALLFCLFSWFFTSCVLIPSKNEKKVLMGTVTAAVVNIGLNLILIPMYQEKAAAFTTLVAEAVALAYGMYNSRNLLKLKVDRRSILSVVFGCLLIFVICQVSTFVFADQVLFNIAVSVPLSVLAYGGTLLITRNPFALSLIDMICHKLGRK